MRPIPHESTASYLHRLAHAYRTTTVHLLDALGIALTHPSSSRAGAGTAELRLDTAAQHQLAVFTRTPLGDLSRALPHLAADRTQLHSPDTGTRRAVTPGGLPSPVGVQRPLEAGEQPVLACPACTLRHTQGATSRARIHPLAHQALCPLHRHWSLDPDNHPTTAALPELRQAQRDHQRLLRHPDAANATLWATAITTRWYDQ